MEKAGSLSWKLLEVESITKHIRQQYVVPTQDHWVGLYYAMKEALACCMDVNKIDLANPTCLLRYEFESLNGRIFQQEMVFSEEGIVYSHHQCLRKDQSIALKLYSDLHWVFPEDFIDRSNQYEIVQRFLREHPKFSYLIPKEIFVFRKTPSQLKVLSTSRQIIQLPIYMAPTYQNVLNNSSLRRPKGNFWSDENPIYRLASTMRIKIDEHPSSTAGIRPDRYAEATKKIQWFFDHLGDYSYRVQYFMMQDLFNKFRGTFLKLLTKTAVHHLQDPTAVDTEYFLIAVGSGNLLYYLSLEGNPVYRKDRIESHFRNVGSIGDFEIYCWMNSGAQLQGFSVESNGRNAFFKEQRNRKMVGWSQE